MRGTQATAKKRFLTNLEKTGNVSWSAAAAGVSRTTVYRWQEDDVEFAADWFDCEEAGVDALDAEATRRALEGSDTLLIFLLKSKRPKIFNDRQRIELTGAEGGPVVIAAVPLSPDELAAAARALVKVSE